VHQVRILVRVNHHHLALQPLLGVSALSARSLQLPLSLAVSFQFLIFIFFRPSMTSYFHCCLGLPTGLVPIGFHSNSFLVSLAWFILCIWPSHLILCALMNPTISTLSIDLSISRWGEIFCFFFPIALKQAPERRFVKTGDLAQSFKYTVSEKDCTHFFFLGAQCVESGVSCTDCY